ncbi:MAG: hypothetical protein QXS20_04725 [Candidatus Thorarchaeota archaeon]
MSLDTYRTFALALVLLLVVPASLTPLVVGYTPGDEAAVFGHTFAEDYWTNSSIPVRLGTGANATMTASYVRVSDFQAFLIAFNEIYTTEGLKFVLPYQLFGMHYLTPSNKEVFIGAIFAFLLVHNESYGNNNLPDVGNENAWFIVPLARDTSWPDVEADVEAIPVTVVEPYHFRFGMRYTNLTCRVVDANNPAGFWLSLLLPIMNILISEFVVQYDVRVGADGVVRAETLYTIGQVTRMKYLGFEIDPSLVIKDTMEISAVHYLSIFTSNYNVTRSSTGHTITPPTSTTPASDNITIKIGSSERAFDIGLGRRYSLYDESTTPWTLLGDDYQALNCLLGARRDDFALIAWQAPFSALIFAHMAYGLSARVRSMYAGVPQLAANAMNAFHNSQWWYAVTFPEWNGYRVQQDPTYVAYTNVSIAGGGGGGIIVIAAIVVGVVALVVIARRR